MISDNVKLCQFSCDEQIRNIMKESNLVIRISMFERIKRTAPRQSIPYIEFLIRKYRNKLETNSDLPF